jgi:hypothetical protein
MREDVADFSTVLIYLYYSVWYNQEATQYTLNFMKKYVKQYISKFCFYIVVRYQLKEFHCQQSAVPSWSASFLFSFRT